MVERNNTRYILRTVILLLLSFSCLALYVVYLQVWKADQLAEHPLNRRAALAEDSVLRGSILDRKGEVLALSPNVGERRYPYGRIMAPVTGYLDDTIGSTGIEAYKGAELSGHSRLLGRLGPLAQLFSSARGDDVYLTLDARKRHTRRWENGAGLSSCSMRKAGRFSCSHRVPRSIRPIFKRSGIA